MQKNQEFVKGTFTGLAVSLLVIASITFIVEVTLKMWQPLLVTGGSVAGILLIGFAVLGLWAHDDA